MERLLKIGEFAPTNNLEDLVPGGIAALNAIELTRSDRQSVRQANRQYKAAHKSPDLRGLMDDIWLSLEEIMSGYCPPYCMVYTIEGAARIAPDWGALSDHMTRNINSDIGPIISNRRSGLRHYPNFACETEDGKVRFFTRKGSGRGYRWMMNWEVDKPADWPTVVVEEPPTESVG